MVGPARPWEGRIGPPLVAESCSHAGEPRHLALWLLSSEPLDLLGYGPVACGDLDPGAPRTALHVTLASGVMTWAVGRAGLLRAEAALMGAGQLPVRAGLAAVRTSALARIRTYVPLVLDSDPRGLAAQAFGGLGMSGEAARASGVPRMPDPVPHERAIPPHLTLSYRAAHTCPQLAMATAILDTLWLVDLGDGEVLDTLQWRRVPVD